MMAIRFAAPPQQQKDATMSKLLLTEKKLFARTA
jgi:hypothetical protein